MDTRGKLVLLEALCALVKRLDAKIVFFVGIGLLRLLDKVVCRMGLPGSAFIDGILVWKQGGADCAFARMVKNLPDFFQNRGGLRRKWGIFRRYLRALRLRVRFHQR